MKRYVQGLIALLLLGLALPAEAQKLSTLPAAAALGGTEQVPIVQSGATVVTTPNAVVTYTNSSNKYTTIADSTGNLSYCQGLNACLNAVFSTALKGFVTAFGDSACGGAGPGLSNSGGNIELTCIGWQVFSKAGPGSTFSTGVGVGNGRYAALVNNTTLVGLDNATTNTTTSGTSLSEVNIHGVGNARLEQVLALVNILGDNNLGGAVSGASSPTHVNIVGSGSFTSTALTSPTGWTALGDSLGITCATGSHVLLIGTNSEDCPLSSTANYLSLEDVLKVTGTNTPSTSAATFGGTLTVTGALSTTGVTTLQSSALGGGLSIGADLSATTRSVNVRKIARITVPTFDNTSAPVMLVGVDNDGTHNSLNWGGAQGSSAVTQSDLQRFFAAAVNTTGGTAQMELTANGMVVDNAGTQPTGTYKGSGTVNVAGGYYVNGTLIPQAIDRQTFAATGTWTKPTVGTPKTTRVSCTGGGGAGGGGARNTLPNLTSGGAAGGAATQVDRTFDTSVLGATEAVTIPVAATGGAGATVDGNAGSAGSGGNPATFGTWLSAPGGGGGQGGALAANSGGGGGGGSVSGGSVGAAGTGGAGGSTGGGAGGSGVGGSSNILGAGGAGTTSGASGNNGGNSITSATGGGSGAGVDATNTARSGGASGRNENNQAATLGGTAGGAGAAGAAATGLDGGLGGGGGANGSSATGGAGGAGTRGGGGGGGGSAVGGNGGVGGAGGGGYCEAVTSF